MSRVRVIYSFIDFKALCYVKLCNLYRFYFYAGFFIDESMQCGERTGFLYWCETNVISTQFIHWNIKTVAGRGGKGGITVNFFFVAFIVNENYD